MSKSGCPFERAILTSAFSCQHAEKYLIAFREGLYCEHQIAFLNCEKFSSHLRENARFALQLPENNDDIPHGKDLKLKCGGLQALKEQLNSTKIDVHDLVIEAIEQYEQLEKLPYSEMLPTIQHYKTRKKRT